jgi:hypothetical protein
VVGDHGMTETGDHGGDSDREVRAALFAYTHADATPFAPYSRPHPAVPQIDLVPTLSLLLDAPIPYASLGAPIDTLFTDDARKIAWRATVAQVARYTQAYAQRPGIDAALADRLNSVLRTFHALTTDELTVEKCAWFVRAVQVCTTRATCVLATFVHSDNLP